MAAVGSTPISFIASYPMNYMNSSTPTDSMVFYYTPGNNGTFQVPQWPSANIENGWFDARGNGNNDHHMSGIDTTTGNMMDIYQYFTLGSSGVCPTCNASSGLKYTYADYVLPANGSANASGTVIAPLTLRSQEFVSAVVNGGAVNHALQMTLTNGEICDSSTANACPVGATGNAAGTRHIWPATTEAFSGGGIVPYGTRLRLKSSYSISGFSAAAQVILTALQHYGVIITDGGLNWQVAVDWDNMPPTEVAALQAITSAHIPVSDFEVVDESSLMESSTSGAVSSGEVVGYTSSTGTKKTHVNLQGSAVNVNTNQYYIMAGTPAQQLTYYSNGSVTCSMSPTVGTLTSGCLYTAPATESSVTSTLVTITSNADAAVKAEMYIYVTPQIVSRFVQGTSDYTDSNGNVWFSNNAYGVGMSNVPSWQGCCQNDPTIPGTDKQLFWNFLASSQTIGDYKVDLHVPNGIYAVAFNNGSVHALGANVRYFYAQGALIATVDPTAVVGQHQQWTLNANVVVNNNVLSFYNAAIANQSQNSGDISSIQVTYLGPLPNGSYVSSGVGLPVGVSIQ